jgi:hypothetical protein
MRLISYFAPVVFQWLPLTASHGSTPYRTASVKDYPVMDTDVGAEASGDLPPLAALFVVHFNVKKGWVCSSLICYEFRLLMASRAVIHYAGRRTYQKVQLRTGALRFLATGH